VFYLGKKYSSALKATYLDETGKPATLEMGCYGIGITRIAAAAIEQNHDERGIIWPRALAPFEVVICPVGWAKSETVRNTAETLYTALRERGIEVILDDRDTRPGVMFAEWELIGAPLRVTVGERGLKDGVVELQARREASASTVPADQALEQVLAKLENL
jgi:prolyl-tRNA synthetase